jgi:hypothetical protein
MRSLARDRAPGKPYRRGKYNSKIKQRNAHGGAGMAEMGPALWIMLMCFFFPMLVLLGMCLSYGSCYVLNNLQTHEAALLNYEDAEDPGGAVCSTIPTDWSNNGMGKFVQLVNPPVTQVSYKLGSINSAKVQDHMVTVSTTCSIKPFVPVPIIAGVPGLSAPVTFTITSDRLVENQDNAPP